MFNANNLLQKFHSAHINLTLKQSQDMQRRRDTNLDRVAEGLAELEKPGFAETINQGGNAMRTITQPPEGDEASRYDIDVGIVFEEADAKTPVTTKTWVCDALTRKGSNFKTAPTLKKKCVRVVYNDGYQVDLPVYRRTETFGSFQYAIAIGDEWVSSDPKAINAWFEERVATLSPSSEDGYQLRRIVRYIKYFAKAHTARTGQKFPEGLVATALAVECYVPVAGRDDEALYLTLAYLRDRSEHLPVIANGIVVSGNRDILRIKRLRDQATSAVNSLAILRGLSARDDTEEVAKAWGAVFPHSFFDSDAAAKAIEEGSNATAAILFGLSAAERHELARKKAAEIAEPARPWRK